MSQLDIGFFEKLFSHNICIAANGNATIPNKINMYKNKKLLVVADGSAFGAHMESCYRKLQYNSKLYLYLPESFEYLILKTGLFNKCVPDIPNTPSVQKILISPENYIEASEFNSWEKFFTKVLISVSQDWSPSYSKNCSEDFFDDNMVDLARKQVDINDFYYVAAGRGNSIIKMSLL